MQTNHWLNISRNNNLAIELLTLTTVCAVAIPILTLTLISAIALKAIKY